MKYLGDISRQDVMVLSRLARQANHLLEFGVGGSTQVLAQSKPWQAQLIAVDTDPHWLSRTQEILNHLPVHLETCTFLLYDDWLVHAAQLAHQQGLWDFVFIDLKDELRLAAAESAWPWLKLQGILAFHDTRRQRDLRHVLQFVDKYYLEISRIDFNSESSNISLIHKKIAEPYQNWNQAERRAAWQTGAEPPPQDWLKRL